MKLTAKYWKILRAVIGRDPNLPSWLRDLARMSLGDLESLASLDEAHKGDFACPCVEEKIVTAEYLSFLRTQLLADTRGPQWKELLTSRLSVTNIIATVRHSRIKSV